MDKKMEFRFYMKDEYDDEFEMFKKISPPDEDEPKLEYLLGVFKDFLKTSGWDDIQISRLQWLDNDEWKYVLTSYRDWDSEKEKWYKYYTENDV